MVEVDAENGGFAVLPGVEGDREVEQDHSLGGVAGVDEGLAQEGFGAKGFHGREGAVDGRDVLLFSSTGVELLSVGGGEGSGEVLDKEGQIEAVGEAQGGEDVEIVLGPAGADDHGVGSEDEVGGIDGDVGDLHVRDAMRSEADQQSDGESEDQESDQNGRKKISAGGLGKLKVRAQGTVVILGILYRIFWQCPQNIFWAVIWN